MLVSQILSTTVLLFFVPVQFYSKIDSLFQPRPEERERDCKSSAFPRHDQIFREKFFGSVAPAAAGGTALKADAKIEPFCIPTKL